MDVSYSLNTRQHVLNERLAEASQAVNIPSWVRVDLTSASSYRDLRCMVRSFAARGLRPEASVPSHLLHPCFSQLCCLLSGREEKNSGEMTKPSAIAFRRSVVTTAR